MDQNSLFSARDAALENTGPFIERHRDERYVDLVNTTKSSTTNAVPVSSGTAKPTLARSN